MQYNGIYLKTFSRCADHLLENSYKEKVYTLKTQRSKLLKKSYKTKAHTLKNFPAARAIYLRNLIRRRYILENFSRSAGHLLKNSYKKKICAPTRCGQEVRRRVGVPPISSLKTAHVLLFKEEMSEQLA